MTTKPLILIVDDTPTNIHVLHQALKDDYRIKVATSGLVALEIARAPERPDLILLDVMMPDLDGYEVCRRLKDDVYTQRIPVVFVTALGAGADEERGLNLGAADYITKPFALPVVRARVRNQIALKLNSDLLESLAFIDGMTRLANRRYFDAALETEWKRAQRAGTAIALIFADIDYFKKLNDHYGHGYGDDCLVKVAASFAGAMERPGDIAARYGGEEFIALLPETDVSGAREVAERFRLAVEALTIAQAPDADFTWVTISLGCASTVPNLENSAATLIESADQALYAAKKAGRNRVGVYGD